MKAHFILYVLDQQASARFYSRVLDLKPSLDVPGMTEFHLGSESVLGLMPIAGIQRLLDHPFPEPAAGSGPKAELYLQVEDAVSYHSRALEFGGQELSPLQGRDWGHAVAYSLDPDGHVLAFAQISKN